MAVFCLSTAHLSAARLRGPSPAVAAGSQDPRQHGRRRPSPRRASLAGNGATIHGLAVALMLVACLAAPEHPGEQASICQRHNGAAACRVW